MRNRTLLTTFAVLLATILLTGMNSQAASVKERMLARLPAINSLKDSGLIGENNQGYLDYRTDARPEQQLIQDENSDRRSVYSDIAKTQKVDAALVGQRRARQISEAGAAGHWFQKPDGAWYRK